MGAGRPKSIDDSKVFDVAKPDKSKPMGTSRPVITGRSVVVKDQSMINEPDQKSDTYTTPSITRRIINPISGDENDQPSGATVEPTNEVQANSEADETSPKSAPEVTESEPITEQSQNTAELKPSADAKAETAPNPESAKTVEAAKETTKEAASTDDKSSEASQPKEVEKKPTGSESATVDALAEASGKPKLDQKEIEEQNKRDAALQELIDSKKYVVPLAHDSTQKSGHKTTWMLILLILLISVGGYLAIDAKIIKTNISLPYHFFSQ